MPMTSCTEREGATLSHAPCPSDLQLFGAQFSNKGSRCPIESEGENIQVEPSWHGAIACRVRVMNAEHEKDRRPEQAGADIR